MVKAGDMIRRCARGRVVRVLGNKAEIEWSTGSKSWTYISGLEPIAEQEYQDAVAKHAARSASYAGGER